MNLSPPPGFQRRSFPHAFAWFRTATEKPIVSFWGNFSPKIRLSEAARRHPKHMVYPGRLPVVSAPVSGLGALVIRPCTHGGLWGSVAGDRYLLSDKVRREIRAGQRLAKLGIPNPQVEAVLFYPAGFFFRIEVVTRQVRESQDLVAFLAGQPSPRERSLYFSAIRKLFDQLHRHGVRHRDLNARNLLGSRSSRGWTAWLLDVDAVHFGDPGSPAIDLANRNRLLRSLLKRARLGDLGTSEAEVTNIWRELFPRR